MQRELLIQSRMTEQITSPSSRDSSALSVALDQSRDVKARVDSAAGDLSKVSGRVKSKVAMGATEAAANLAISSIVRVEGDVQECANDLDAVNESLARSVADLRTTEEALVTTKAALAASKASLATSKEAENDARIEALHDSATGLPNRVHFNSQLSHSIAHVQRQGLQLAVMFLDVDKFKLINDTHGHAAGDAVLLAVSERLSARCRGEDMVCRNGGDEFLYLLMCPGTRADITTLAESVRASLACPVAFGDLQLLIDSSIGIAMYPGDGGTPDDLVRSADAAMYESNRAGGGVRFYAAPRADVAVLAT